MSPRTADPDTRTAVVEAAARILGEEGPAALTTRRLATEAGTSTMAVYTRFGGMAEIRRAVREVGFGRLDARLDALPSTDDPVADLVAAGAAFYAAGLAEPYLYRAMFLDRPVEEDDTGVGVYQRLVALVERCLAARRFPARDAGLVPVWAAELWSMRHGMVIMALTEMLPPEQARFVVDDMTYRLLVGFGDEPDRARASLAAGNRAARDPGADEDDHADSGGAVAGGPATPDRADSGDAGRLQTLWERTGGVAGLVQSSLPPTTLVLANSLWGLHAAVACAVGVAVLVTVVRVARRQQLRPAFGGFVGVAVSGFLAVRSGEARDFFLADIWWYAIASVVLTASILVGRPLVGVLWSAMRGVGGDWRHDPGSRRVYTIATAVVASVFAARFVVQQWLYVRDEVGWMTFAKISMNYPLWAAALLVVAWAARRSDARLAYCDR